ncbi:MAG: aldo/keto reductase [Gudongella sp.]|nr:aldo/keto reductase [Gudongella sp.]
MLKRTLGRTNFNVSSVGFGGIPIQRVTKEVAAEMLIEALNQGINFIDTARGYMESEALLGEALQVVGRDNFYLATKSFNRTYDGVLKDLNISLSLLKTDRIDLFQFHNVKSLEDYNNLIADGAALDAIKKAKEDGIVKEIGISSHSLDVLNVAVKTDHFATIQFPYNAVERQAEDLFRIAHERNIGVIVMKPLAGGAIQNGELALRFILENQNVSVVIPGMDCVEQVIENTKPGHDGKGLSEDQRKNLEKEAAELGTQFCRRCGYCAPCSVGIDIPTQFILDSYFTRYNLQEWAQTRYNSQEIKASDCIDCGLCEPRCPYNLPIREMLKKVASHY